LPAAHACKGILLEAYTTIVWIGEHMLNLVVPQLRWNALGKSNATLSCALNEIQAALTLT
jgi:hypothetical protein